MDDVTRYLRERQDQYLPTLAYRPPIFKPLPQVPVRGRLIQPMTEDGKKLAPFHQFMQHWNNNAKKYQICSSKWEPGQKGVFERVEIDKHKCLGCYLQYQWTPAVQRRIPKKTVSTSLKQAVTIFVMADFHMDPFDFKGNPMGTNREGDPIFRRLMCARPKKPIEGAPLPKCAGCDRGLTTEYGRKLAWYLTRSDLDILVAGTIGHKGTCANCYTKNSLKTLGFSCSHCGEVFASATKDNVEIRDSSIKCGECGAVDYPTEFMQCSNCNRPRRPTMFDGDLWVMKSSADFRADLVVHKFKVCAPHKRIEGDDSKAFDFKKKLMPEPLTAQMQIHDIQVSPWDEGEAPVVDYQKDSDSKTGDDY